MTQAPPSARVRVTRDYVNGRFGQVHLRIARPAGDAGKTPLLCFHMSPNSGRVYAGFLAAMGVDRLAVAPDTPGFGESDAPAQPPSIEDYAAAMGDVIDALGLGPVDLMGYHTGSETSVALALARPGQVRRLVLVSAPIFTTEELVEFRRLYDHDPITADGSHLVKKWQAHVYWAGPGKTLDMVADDFHDGLRNPAISWWGHHAAFSYDMARQLARVTQPMLVLNPDDDLHQQTLRAAGRMHDGRILHLPNWGHGFLDVHTDAARRIVTDFLDTP
jgi:pimeloyl-ACP methyl ester carboxylesterase